MSRQPRMPMSSGHTGAPQEAPGGGLTCGWEAGGGNQQRIAGRGAVRSKNNAFIERYREPRDKHERRGGGWSDREGVGLPRRENDQAEEAHQEQQFGQV